MRGLGSAALAAARLFGGIEKGKLQGAQRAREDVNARKAEEEAERRAMLDEMVKRSTMGRNEAETAEQLRATSAAPKTFKEMLEREAAGRNPAAPRNIDRLSPEGQTAEVDLARKLEPYRSQPQPRVDPEDAERRQVERERRAWVASKTREYMKGDPVRGESPLGTVEAKARATAEADEVYGPPKGPPRAGGAPRDATEQAERALERIKTPADFQAAMDSPALLPETKQIIRQRYKASSAPPPRGQDRL